MRLTSLSSLLAVASIIVGGCGGPQIGHPQHCAEGDRVQVDCTSEVSYQGVDAHGNLSALGAFQASGQFQEVAIRRVNENIAQYIAAQTRLCRDYNSCAIDAATYRSESNKTRDKLLAASDLAGKLGGTTSDSEQTHLLDKLYSSVVPQAERTEELTFQMAVVAELPPSSGGGTFNVAPSQPLPTNSRVAFAFQTSSDAHLYIFQVNASGEVTVLFPDPRIGTSNPLRGGTATRVPSQGQTFRLNDKDIGVEKVYIVASRKPVTSLDSVAAKVNSGQVTQVGQDPLLAQLASVKPAGEADCQGTRTRGLELEGPPSQPGTAKCTRTRGLVLDAGDGAGTDKPSLSARTAPGDDTIVKVFPFTHVAEPQYAQAKQGFQSQQGARTRGIIVDD
jgi:hypothetical protein